MKSLSKAILLSVTLLVPASLFAQGGSYTLKQLLDVALKNNNNVVKATLDIQEGREKTKEVTSAALPQISINSDVNNNVIRQAMVLPKQFVDPSASPDDYMVIRAGMHYTTSVNAQATQQLFNMGVMTGIKAAKESENYYNYNKDRVEEEVIRQISSLFYQAAAIDAQRDVLKSNLQETQKNLSIATERFKNGLVRKLDVDRLKVGVTNLQTQISQLEDNYQKTVNQLKLSAGMEIEDRLELVTPVLDSKEAYVYDSALVDSDWSYDDKIESKVLRTQLSLYDIEKKNFASGYYPTLSAYGNYSYQGQSNNFFLSGNSNPMWFDIASVGLRLSLPVFDGFQKSARIQQSRIRHIKTERDLQFSKKQSSMEYVTAKSSFETSYKNYLAQKENVALANSVYDVTQQNFNEGVSPLTDLIQAETSRIQAQNQLITALLNVKQAEIDLLKAKGEIKSLLND